MTLIRFLIFTRWSSLSKMTIILFATRAEPASTPSRLLLYIKGNVCDKRVREEGEVKKRGAKGIYETASLIIKSVYVIDLFSSSIRAASSSTKKVRPEKASNNERP